jgi:serine/threonine protein kinase
MATSVYDQLEPPMSYNYRDVPELKELFLEKVQKTGIRLGCGAFGVVEELTVGSTHYAGKTLHSALLDAHNEGKDRIIERFISECKMVSQVRHPNIVQFMGLCLFRNSIHPSIVMEKLDLSLENVLEAYCNLPLPLIVRILKDIVKGLIYLHGKSPPIVHCDLTARNVLVNKASMFAKIADLGNALMIDPAQLSNTLSQTPGTLLYMPPEAILCKPKYDSMLDMFSFGHLGLFAATQKYPGNLLPPTYTDPSTEKLQARSEVERREEYISILVDKLSEDHAVTKVIFQCLHNSPEKRYANLPLFLINTYCLSIKF